MHTHTEYIFENIYLYLDAYISIHITYIIYTQIYYVNKTIILDEINIHIYIYIYIHTHTRTHTNKLVLKMILDVIFS